MSTELAKNLIGLGIHSEPAVLIGDGAGGTPGGTSGQLQFNNASAFGGTTNLEFDSTNNALRGLVGLTQGIRLYNTADITTNTEYLRSFWSSNVAHIITDTQGTGTQRELRFGTFSGGVAQNMVRVFGSSGTPFVRFTNASSTNTSFVGWDFVNGSLLASSGTQTLLSLSSTINQSGTAGYTGVDINVTHTTTGSGGKQALQTRLGGTVQFQIGDTGRLRHIAANSATTVGAAGGASALPATPTGYLIMEVGGTPYKFPYYAV